MDRPGLLLYRLANRAGPTSTPPSRDLHDQAILTGPPPFYLLSFTIFSLVTCRIHGRGMMPALADLRSSVSIAQVRQPDRPSTLWGMALVGPPSSCCCCPARE